MCSSQQLTQCCRVVLLNVRDVKDGRILEEDEGEGREENKGRESVGVMEMWFREKVKRRNDQPKKTLTARS